MPSEGSSAGDGGKNFRANLYQKVGMEREAVDFKLALEQILKEPVVDLTKLQKFALKYQVLPTHSLQVWKLMLGVSSPNAAAAEFIDTQREEQFRLLWRSLNLMRKSQVVPAPGTQLSSLRTQSKDLLKLFLLEEGRLGLNDQLQIMGDAIEGALESFCYADPAYEPFLRIADRMAELCPNDCSTYWLSKEAYRYVAGLSTFDAKGNFVRTELTERQIQFKMNEHRKMLERMVACTKQLLLTSDSELYEHMESAALWKHIPLLSWFESCFAQIFASQPLSKLWNTVFAGSFESMIYVAVELLKTLRKQLMAFDEKLINSARIPSEAGSRDETWCTVLTEYCAQLTEDTQGTVIYRGLDRWSRESGRLMPKTPCSASNPCPKPISVS